MPTKPQHIISLSVQNFMRISAVNIELSPEGELVILAGDNEQGKSSVIKAIEYVLGGKRSDVMRPIRDGANEAKVSAKLTDYIVTRTTSSNGTSAFKVTTHDKKAVSSPQTLLDGFIGALSFDPLEFHRQATKEPARAIETLKSLASLDFSAMDKRREELYDERTDANRTLAASKARSASLTRDTSVPAEELTTEGFVKELSVARQTNKLNSEARAKFQAVKNSLQHGDELIQETQLEIERLQKVLAKVESERAESISFIDRESPKVASLVDVDEDSIAQRMCAIDVTNTKIRANKKLSELEADIEVDQKSVDELTSEIEKIDAEKERMLSTAKFPVAGISFNDAGVVLGGVPWVQCSTAQRLKATTSIGIALNPGLRAILIREGGNDLDKNSMAIMGQIAKDSDCHIILERVSVGPETSFVIEDGHIKQ